MKHCYKCGRDLPLTEFHRNRSRPDGLQDDCKECRLAAKRERRKRADVKAHNRAYKREWLLRRRIDRKLEQLSEPGWFRRKAYAYYRKREAESDRQQRELLRRAIADRRADDEWAEALLAQVAELEQIDEVLENLSDDEWRRNLWQRVEDARNTQQNVLLVKYLRENYDPPKRQRGRPADDYIKIDRDLYNRIWRPNKYRARKKTNKHRRRAQITGAAITTLTASEWAWLVEQYGGRCAYCGRKTKLTQDHVVPISRGGNHSLSNVVPACMDCNLRKNAHTPEEVGMTFVVEVNVLNRMEQATFLKPVSARGERDD